MSSTQSLPPTSPNDYHSSSVDLSRPFTSVKQAVAIFDERLLAQDNTKSSTSTTAEIFMQIPSFDNHMSNDGILDPLRKLEVELEETKTKLKLLNERDLEGEIMLASLNAELQMNMLQLATITKKAAANGDKEEERRRMRENFDQSLGEISGEEMSCYFGSKREKKTMMMKKKKPIIPLIGDFVIFKKNGLSSSSNAPLRNLY